MLKQGGPSPNKATLWAALGGRLTWGGDWGGGVISQEALVDKRGLNLIKKKKEAYW